MSKLAIKPAPNALYEADVYAWAQQQAKLLRDKGWADLDLDNLVLEVQWLGTSTKREIESRLDVLMAHLLKWKYQPGARSSSWRGTILAQRLAIERIIKHSPSLKRYPAKDYLDEYLGARLAASEQTGIAFDLFPEECPFTIAEILDVEFVPEEPGHLGAKPGCLRRA